MMMMMMMPENDVYTNGSNKTKLEIEDDSEYIEHGYAWKYTKSLLSLITFCVLCAKAYTYNKTKIVELLYFKQLSRFDWTDSEGKDWFTYRWVEGLNYPWLSPLLCGLGMTLFTWSMVYLDSRQPGVYPPSPFNTKMRRNRIASFHLGYVVAVLSGVLIFFLMYFCEFPY